MKEIESQELIKEAKLLNKKYNFFITINNKKGKGIPISVKDNICTKDLRTTAGSKILENYKPGFNATIINDLKGYIIGKTVMDEFGFGTFSTNTPYSAPKNPLDPTRTCGGSSGGSAGYVKASKYSGVSIAESTGGSISCPAAFCSVTGLTPTYGLISRYGLIDYANSLDRLGLITKSVSDIKPILKTISNYDKKDSTSIKERTVKKSQPRKIAIPKEYFNNIDKKIEKEVWNSIHKLETEGITYKEISLKLTDYALPTYYILSTAEASTNLAKFSGIRYGKTIPLESTYNNFSSKVREEFFGKEAKRRSILGTFVRSIGYRGKYYIKAAKVRTLIIEEFKNCFKEYDAIVAPTMPILPPRFSEIKNLTPLQQYMTDILTVPPSLAGIPMLSIPAKKDQPIGLHILGDHLQEEKILAIGEIYERTQN